AQMRKISRYHTWNQMPPIRAGSEVSISESTVLDSFFYAAINIGAATTSIALPLVVAHYAGVDIANVSSADPVKLNEAYRDDRFKHAI
ncbi:MAG: hypothetical protein EBX62_04935, partial [Betaproteobacteria bacterium]|nr:hypothetical protein [Betaproteobacteria bacterium]